MEGGGRKARSEETQTLLSTNQKLCILSSLGVVVYKLSSLSYYCEQSIAKFDIKTGVVVYKLVKQLSLIIVAELRY